MRRFACWLADTGPVLVLAVIAGAGSFTHIRDTAADHGQTGWMSWAVAVCIDLTCVMAARERQRDKKTGRVRQGRISWPILVLAGGIVLSLAANLAQAEPTVWGWITAATPAGAFLVAVSMLERRAAGPRPEPSPVAVSVLKTEDEPQDERENAPAPALLDYARRVAEEHHAKHGKPITRDALRSHLGVSNQLASDLLHTLRTA
ncbi:DUF2637 domain-containing protein [Nonomuraea africana]|uniref:DUF2637 domain-containing protein n=1 Tax=Nonomuraea africana TaxID=46171 RepID=A0ABR9KPN8_9ACTN|nr:DUF2637 domain-containing protein [Nonomuraea africana]MBE1563578.1 hypothetical protein [Nonomuraea africana]